MQTWYKEAAEGLQEFIKSAGIEIGVAFAGLAGSYVAISKRQNLTWLEKIISVISGTLTAYFLTPLAIDISHLNSGTGHGFSFLIGFGGMTSIDMAFTWVKTKFPKQEL
jgi:hypothetical protein